MGMTSFREVLEKMLVIVVLPVRKSLRKEVELFSPHLVSNTCGLLASIVSELTASALGSEVVCTQLTPMLSCTDAHKDINKTVILLFSIALSIKHSLYVIAISVVCHINFVLSYSENVSILFKVCIFILLSCRIWLSL